MTADAFIVLANEEARKIQNGDPPIMFDVVDFKAVQSKLDELLQKYSDQKQAVKRLWQICLAWMVGKSVENVSTDELESTVYTLTAEFKQLEPIWKEMSQFQFDVKFENNLVNRALRKPCNVIITPKKGATK